MRSMLAVILSIGLAVLSWGVYGPVLHAGQNAMDHSRLRPFVCVGLAYFLIAVLVPIGMLMSRSESGGWSRKGILFSLAAGAAGAIGALGVIMAFTAGGNEGPILVMPLVFGCAPVVNTFVTMFLTRGRKEVGPVFLAGLLMVVAGAVAVLVFKPGTTHAAPSQGLIAGLSSSLAVIGWVTVTALCWGLYGPILHKGQAAMSGSRWRPFICVGLAYFLIAVIIPLFLLPIEASGGWTFKGSVWSLVGGAAGALGALGIIMAFNFGGKPVYVMPLVFGGAPVVNTFVETMFKGGYERVSPLYFAGLLLVAAGAVTVLVFAPKPHAAAPKRRAESQELRAESQELKVES
jgi:drug/metabolite transporter (DMT)-like permease